MSDFWGYVQWRNFMSIIDKAKIACENAGMDVSDHFADIRKMIGFRKGGQRDVETMHVITHRKVFG